MKSSSLPVKIETEIKQSRVPLRLLIWCSEFMRWVDEAKQEQARRRNFDVKPSEARATKQVSKR